MSETISRMKTEELFDLLSLVKMGDVNLVEDYSSGLGSELALYIVAMYYLKKGLIVLVEDVFDTFPLYVRHLRFSGADFPVETVGVVKVGGVDECSSLVERVQFEPDPRIYLRKKEKAIKRAVGDDRFVHIILGWERLFALMKDVKDFHVLVNHLRELIGNENRTVYLIIDGNVVEGFKINPLPMLESVATSVLAVYPHGDMVNLHFRKSIYPFIKGSNTVFVSPRDVLEI